MRGKGRGTFIAAFLAPAAAFYLALVVWPLIQAVQFSAYRWRGLSMNRTFVGFDNFRQLGADGAFWQAVTHNLWLLVAGGAVVVAVAVAVAHGVRGGGPVARALRSVYLFPQVVSLVVVAVMWQFVFNPAGLLNSGLRSVGLGSLTRTWLGEGQTALFAVGVAFVWAVAGFYVMLFSAGLEQIPGEVNEAAELDGCHGLGRFWKVTWPMLWSVKRVAVVYLVINVMNVFALVFLMTRGGPDRRSEVMLTYLYEQAFVNSQFGYATAIAVANFAVAMLVSLMVLFWFRRDPTERRA